MLVKLPIRLVAFTRHPLLLQYTFPAIEMLFASSEVELALHTVPVPFTLNPWLAAFRVTVLEVAVMVPLTDDASVDPSPFRVIMRPDDDAVVVDTVPLTASVLECQESGDPDFSVPLTDVPSDTLTVVLADISIVVPPAMLTSLKLKLECQNRT